MDKKLHQAYLDLTLEVLSSDSTKISEILEARREFANEGWLEWLEQAAIQQEEQGNLQGANQIYNLRDSAAQLVALETAKTTMPFWVNLWQAIFESNCNPQVIEPLLRANLGKLTDTIAQIMPTWAANFFLTVPPEGWSVIAGLFVNFGNLMFRFPLGNRASNLEIAIAGYNIGLDVYTQAESPEQWAIVQNSLGVTYNNRLRGQQAENLEQAIAYYQNALQVYTKDTYPQQWAMVQDNLGTAYNSRILGDQAQNIEQAILCHQNALEVYNENPYSPDLARAYCNLGIAYRSRIYGEQDVNLEQAIVCLRNGLRVYARNNSQRGSAETLKNLALLYSEYQQGNRARNLERAIKYLHKVLRIYNQVEFPEKWAETQRNLGLVYWRLKEKKATNIEQAINCYQNALEIYTENEFPEKWAEVQNALAVAWSNRVLGEHNQNLEQAVNCCQAALRVRTQKALPQFYAETQLNLGLIYRDLQQLDFAYSAFVTAIDTVDLLRGEIISGDVAKRKLSEKWHQIYINIITICFELAVKEPQYLAKAITYIERSKTRTLVELILNRDNSQIFSPEVADELQQIQNEINEGQKSIQSGSNSNPTALAESLHNLRQKRNQIQNNYLKIGSSFDLLPFLSTLDKQTAVVEWFIADGEFFTFIITPNSCSDENTDNKTEASSLISLKENDVEIRAWKSASGDLINLANWLERYFNYYYENKEIWQSKLTQRLEELPKILRFDSLLALLPEDCNQVILVPHTFLHLLPLHALPASNTTLVDRFSRGVRYTPSCQLLQLAQKRQRADFTHFFAVQDPTNDLAYTAIEVEAISSNFNVPVVLKGSAATKAAITTNALFKNTNCLHFACHGLFDLVSPENSALQLADAPLELTEIFTLCLEKVRLVTLSACETGLTDFGSLSDEYIGLPGAFIYAGSSSVISSLWAVDDLSTSLLMLRFYENLSNGFSVSVALNQAQKWLREATKVGLSTWVVQTQLPLPPALRMSLRRYLHQLKDDTKPFWAPFYWAGFFAVGE